MVKSYDNPYGFTTRCACRLDVTIVDLPKTVTGQVTAARPGTSGDALSTAYDRLGFDDGATGDQVFRNVG